MVSKMLLPVRAILGLLGKLGKLPQGEEPSSLLTAPPVEELKWGTIHSHSHMLEASEPQTPTKTVSSVPGSRGMKV